MSWKARLFKLGIRNEKLGIGGGERERRGLFERIFRGAGMVKTVPYRLFYYVLLINKCTVGRDAVIPPGRNVNYLPRT